MAEPGRSWIGFTTGLELLSLAIVFVKASLASPPDFPLSKVHGKLPNILFLASDGIPSVRMGVYGYDNYREKHFFVWFDSFSTMPMWGEGEEQPDGTIVYYSKLPDPVTGKDIHYKSVSRLMSDGTHHFTMSEKKDGSWWTHMEMVGTRQ